MKLRHATGYVSTSILLGATGLYSAYDYATCTSTIENLACLGPSAQLKLWLALTYTTLIFSVALVALDYALANYYGDQR